MCINNCKKGLSAQLLGFALAASLLLTLEVKTTFAQPARAFEPAFEKDVILLKLTAPAARQLNIRVINGIVQTGVASLDALNQQYKAQGMKRILRHGGKLEDKHAQFGLTRYYKMTFTAGMNVEALVQAYRANANIEAVQPNRRYVLFENGKGSRLDRARRGLADTAIKFHSE